jgi:hypothetical protein
MKGEETLLGILDYVVAFDVKDELYNGFQAHYQSSI